MKKVLGIISIGLFFLLAACNQLAKGPDAVLDPQIRGGTLALPTEHRSMALIVNTHPSINELECGGTLIDRSWVLTAATCTAVGDRLDILAIVLGEHDRGVDEGTEQTLAVSERIVHPDFDERTGQHDIALLHLASPATLNASATLASLGNLPAAGSTLRVIGWGNFNYYCCLLTIPFPLKVDLPLRTDAQCRAVHPDLDTFYTFCAGDGTWVDRSDVTITRGTGPIANSADRNAPIFISESDIQVGLLTAYSGRGGDPINVYTKIAPYRDWILSVISAPPAIVLPSVLVPCMWGEEPGCRELIVEVQPDLCLPCFEKLTILSDKPYSVHFSVPALELNPDAFAKTFKLSAYTTEGKLVAEAVPNQQEAMLELPSPLGKGDYELQIEVLDQNLAQQLNGSEKFPFVFTFDAAQ
jgi:Trypsin